MREGGEGKREFEGRERGSLREGGREREGREKGRTGEGGKVEGRGREESGSGGRDGGREQGRGELLFTNSFMYFILGPLSVYGIQNVVDRLVQCNFNYFEKEQTF